MKTNKLSSLSLTAAILVSALQMAPAKGMDNQGASSSTSGSKPELTGFLLDQTIDFELESRKIVLQFLDDKKSCLKQRLLDREKVVLPLWNMFLVYLNKPKNIKNNDALKKILNKTTKTIQDEKDIAWYLQYQQLEEEASWKYTDSYGPQNCHTVSLYVLKKVMPELNYDVEQIIEDEYPLIYTCAQKIEQNSDAIKYKLAELKKEASESQK